MKTKTNNNKNGNATASKVAVKAATKAAVKPATKTNGKATKVKVAAVKKANKRQAKVLELFGHPVNEVARALHGAGLKPLAVIRAIQSLVPKAPANSLRSCCRTGQKAVANLAVAELTKTQLAALKKAGEPVEVEAAA